MNDDDWEPGEPEPEDSLEWDLEERDRLLAEGVLTDPDAPPAPVTVLVEADE